MPFKTPLSSKLYSAATYQWHNRGNGKGKAEEKNLSLKLFPILESRKNPIIYLMSNGVEQRSMGNWKPRIRKNGEENAQNCLRANWKHPDKYPGDEMIIVQ